MPLHSTIYIWSVAELWLFIGYTTPSLKFIGAIWLMSFVDTRKTAGPGQLVAGKEP